VAEGDLVREGCSTGVTSLGCAASTSRSGIGGDNTLAAAKRAG